MTGALLPAPLLLSALLQEGPAAEEARKGDLMLFGYALVAAGVLDLFLALFFTVLRPVPDPRAKAILGGAMAFGGLAMIVVGVLMILGTIGP